MTAIQASPPTHFTVVTDTGQDVGLRDLHDCALLWDEHRPDRIKATRLPSVYLVRTGINGVTPVERSLCAAALSGQDLFLHYASLGQDHARVLKSVRFQPDPTQFTRAEHAASATFTPTPELYQLMTAAFDDTRADFVTEAHWGRRMAVLLSTRALSDHTLRLQPAVPAPPHRLNPARSADTTRVRLLNLDPVPGPPPPPSLDVQRSLAPIDAPALGVTPQRWNFRDLNLTETYLLREQEVLDTEVDLAREALRNHTDPALWDLIDHALHVTSMRGVRLGGRLALRAQADAGYFESSGLPMGQLWRALDPNQNSTYHLVARWARVVERVALQGLQEAAPQDLPVQRLAEMVGPTWSMVRAHLKASGRFDVENGVLTPCPVQEPLPNPQVALLALNSFARTWRSDSENGVDPVRSMVSASLARWAYALKDAYIRELYQRDVNRPRHQRRLVSHGVETYRDARSVALTVIPPSSHPEWPSVNVHMPLGMGESWVGNVPEASAPRRLLTPDEAQALMSGVTPGQLHRVLEGDLDRAMGLK
jgi:hypothetical protein